MVAGKVTWAHCTHRFNASSSVPASRLRPILDRGEEGWQQCQYSRAKEMVNAWIGSLGITEHFAYRMVTSDHPDDGAGSVCLDVDCKMSL